MKELNLKEFCDYFKIAESTATTKFNRFATRKLSKGILITKTGMGSNTKYFVDETDVIEKPTIEDYCKISNQEIKRGMPYIPIEGEIWKPCIIAPYEISNLGRVKKDNKIFKHYINNAGYHQISLNRKNYLVHRLVLIAFNPIEGKETYQDYNDLTVDHINGIRDDNTPNNLHWCSQSENSIQRNANRVEMNKEITRLIMKYGYEETLKKLEQL